MWDAVKLPVSEKIKFLSNPRNGSLHNYGAAVDISIVNENGLELDMGTPYDFMGELAYPGEEDELSAQGKLSFRQLQNRKLLREVMEASGFTGIATEWWHFNACTRDYAKMHYRLIP
jgi:zinc D-Ala-D-Ala dipeptidase